MSRDVCRNAWQAEAERDGRLGPAERASFARHAPSCADCTAELASLAALDDAMGALPSGERTALEHRRARQALLRAADAEIAGRAPVRRAPWLYATAAAAVLVLAVGAALRLSHPVHTEAVAVATAQFEVADVAAAQWSRETTGATTRLALRAGTAGFHVEHLEGAARFLVSLPDGEIEVRGTRFVVAVDGGHTRSVEVTEGTVALTLPGYAGLLRAGERWPAVAPAQASPTPSAPSAPPSSAAIDPPAATDRHVASPAPAPSPPSAPSVSTAATAPATSAAGTRFGEAMSAYSAADYGRADALFEAFVRDYPRDGRAEDATFLRADARARRGDAAGAASIAKQYLRAFPHGLRRTEARRLAGD